MVEIAQRARAAGAATWVRRLSVAAIILGFAVVVFGAYVRLTAAGLGCPDWPGCYGHITPIGAEHSVAAADAAYPALPLNVGKAWREMIHRYAASTLGLLILLIAAIAIARRRERIVNLPFALALLAIVVFQGALGMLTVTLRLKPLIVTSHLLGGMTTISLLWWLVLSVHSKALARAGPLRAARPPPRTLRIVSRLVVVALVVLGLQIFLGGWTSTNYAAVACPDFPTCQGSWWPHMDFRDAFVLWHGLDINFQGGILTHPARVAIHFTHRMGALVTTIVLLTAAITVLRKRALARAHIAAAVVIAALALQLTIGISMVLRGFPLWLATAHNAGAAVLLLSMIALYHRLRVACRLDPAAERPAPAL